MENLFKMHRSARLLKLVNYSRRPLSIGSTTPTSLARLFAARIRSTGAMTIAEYMRESLIHPTLGYYSKKETFVGVGDKKDCDFVTSPEISSIFGELLAVWIVHQVSVQQSHLADKNHKMNLVEFGPGSGTMLSDILTTFTKLATTNPQTKLDWYVHLVEASQQLTVVQRDKLSAPDIAKNFPHIEWHNHMDDVFKSLSAPTVFIGHEFLDALPIHKFQRVDDKGFREILVDLDASSDVGDRSQPKFKYVLARGPTPVSITFSPSPEDTRKHVEVCPAAVRIVDRVARHLAAQKFGLALFADYGHVGEGEDTFRAYSKSVQKEPLSVEPGSSDLTADVDFARLVTAVSKINGVRAIGPVTQREFLVNMGFLHRLDVLLRACRNKADREGLRRLMGQAEMLLSDKHMGSRFKFMAILPETGTTSVDPSVAGFNPLS